ncbi:hypothetical protein BJF79_20830 [Actinomadura sp. CNU-125]|uniref:DUF6744 family protein n=1 Tax=Actinomadura sp. CNU-125 TaxID=1904961 RepID=UPI00096312BB|nr:DUF6744 family protein [Actinomadura sp. CNU-125]OLT13318.1 hypothetical protein BJF79_20830 [Actinomadura sp. CNU-125]
MTDQGTIGAASPKTGTAGGGAPSSDAVQAGFDAYTAALEGEGAPLLGHLVLYSVFDGRVTRDDLERWFLELGLDSAFLPPPIRPVDAFEQITGRKAIRLTYPLDGQRPVIAGGKRARRATDGTAHEATLMLRHVRRDSRRIVRHLVREVRDEQQARLTYDTDLAELVFARDSSGAAGPGAGSLQITPDHAAIAQLSPDERSTVHAVLAKLRESYDHRCVFFTSDRLRALIRAYVESMDALRVRPSGGVYFVHRAHTDRLASLRELVSRMGGDSSLVRVPIPDQDEMREMIIAAFTTKARDDLESLAHDIATAQSSGAHGPDVEQLYRRFQELRATTKQHSDLLDQPR